MLTNSKIPSFSASFGPMARAIATVLFIVIVVAAVVKNWGPISDSIGIIGPIILIFNLLTMFFRYGVSKLVGLKNE